MKRIVSWPWPWAWPRRLRPSLIAVACLALVACAGVLGLTRKPSQTFPHRAHVTAGIACTKCHAEIDKTQGLHIPDDAACTAACHTKPHDARSCMSCHATPGVVESLVDAQRHLKFQHARHTAPSRGNCVRCHVAIAEGDEHLRPAMATCFACHAHDGARDARKCEACHINLDDAKTLPQSHLAHDGDWLREHGTRAASSSDACASCHQESFCASCHGQTVPALAATRSFTNPFAATAHRAGFASRHSLEARAEPGLCTTCHTASRCASCHAERGIAGENRRSPHPAGWLGPVENQHGREARRDPSACAACHDGAGQSLCVSCHKVGGIGGNPHPAGWSSNLPRTAMPCRMCHPIGGAR